MNKPVPSGEAISRLLCVTCRDGALSPAENGDLSCVSCAAIFKRQGSGVYNFLSAEAARQENEGPDAGHWDDHWAAISAVDDSLISQEVAYIDEMAPGIIEGSVLIDAGCGTARNLEAYLRHRPRAIYLCDLSNLESAAARLSRLAGRYPDTEVMLLQCDILDLPVRASTDNVYVCCGLLNILPDQKGAIEHAQKLANQVFFLFNSPDNVFGKIYYGLNPVRTVAQFLVRNSMLKRLISWAGSFLAYPLALVVVGLKNRELLGMLHRRMIEFLIFDWVFSSPNCKPMQREFFGSVNPETFSCTITEKDVSRIVRYQRNGTG